MSVNRRRDKEIEEGSYNIENNENYKSHEPT